VKVAEACHCGAAFELQGKVSAWVALNAVEVWREQHACPEPDSQHGGEATIETAPDYQEPELHIGFHK
jgi:hypothetical protein